MYITSGRRTIRLGSLQGVYERFPIRKLTGIVHLHRRDCREMGPSSSTSSMWYVCWGGGEGYLYCIDPKGHRQYLMFGDQETLRGAHPSRDIGQ